MGPINTYNLVSSIASYCNIVRSRTKSNIDGNQSTPFGLFFGVPPKNMHTAS